MNPNIVSAFKNCLLIAAVLCLLVSSTSAASFQLLWDENIETVSGYRVYMRENFSDEFRIIWEGSENNHDVDDTDLAYDTVYVFVVRAFNTYGESENSNSVEYEKPSSNGGGGCFISSIISSGI